MVMGGCGVVMAARGLVSVLYLPRVFACESITDRIDGDAGRLDVLYERSAAKKRKKNQIKFIKKKLKS